MHFHCKFTAHICSVEQSISNNLPVVIADIEVGTFGFVVSSLVGTIVVADGGVGVLTMTLLGQIQCRSMAVDDLRFPTYYGGILRVILHHCALFQRGFAAPHTLIISNFFYVASFFSTMTGFSNSPVIKIRFLIKSSTKTK